MLSAQQKTQKGQELPNFTEDEARAYFESQRWPNGPVCGHCGAAGTDVTLLDGGKHRAGLYQCKKCRGQFTVTMGTVMEDSHLPLAKWALGFHFMATAKKGMSALQLMRNLGLGSYRTAWHMAHRIREAMKGPVNETPKPMDGIVEIDETYCGGRVIGKGRAVAMKHKTPVVSLVERQTGQKRSFVFPNVSAHNLLTTIKEQTAATAEIHSDDSSLYKKVRHRQEHHSVNHSKGEYVRYQLDPRKPGGVNTVTTNLVESSFALLKRGIYGTFHNVSKRHLFRYVGEFDFRWNHRVITDIERRDAAVRGAEGKRLLYKEPLPKPLVPGQN